MKLDIPVVGILRGIEASFFNQIMLTSFAAGLQAIEITMNTEGALDIVSRNRPQVAEDKLLGMGTIRNQKEAKAAIAAGAMFLVTPNLDCAVIDYANSKGIPVIAGALTPTEIYIARRTGAAMIKVFPCQAMGGPQYIKDLRGPFDDIPLVAVGGVNTKNLDEYFKAGAQAVGVSSSLFGRKALTERDISLIGQNVREFIKCCKQSLQSLD